MAAAVVLPVSGCATGSVITSTRSEPGPSIGSPAVVATPPDDNSPAVVGSRLHMLPGESAAARALALADELAMAKTQNEVLASRVHELETDLEANDKALARAATEVAETRTALSNARAELERWKQELVALRVKLQDADKENLTTLQTTVSLLQQLIARESKPGGEGQ